ncbi:hypothetical protein AB1Y20_003113 [Prymnesium parvum]|uniref:Uncharacterized protein n=1 Tax=Prymnesium parvum TaxID=97485 RepID=A0AB34JDD5_PRYPA
MRAACRPRRLAFALALATLPLSATIELPHGLGSIWSKWPWNGPPPPPPSPRSFSSALPSLAESMPWKLLALLLLGSLLYAVYAPRLLPTPPPLDNATLLQLFERGFLPVIAYPAVDEEAGNGIKRVFVAEYEGCVELTIVFWDEDRPTPLLALLYDLLRYPLFGRWEDVESILIWKDKSNQPARVHFPGTYSGDATWHVQAPQHLKKTLPYKAFENFRQSDDTPMASQSRSAPIPRQLGPVSRPPIIIWCNTWNHAFSERNTNSGMPLVFRHPMPTMTCTRYHVCRGSRAEVDARFCGLLKSFVETVPSSVRAQLGKRLL